MTLKGKVVCRLKGGPIFFAVSVLLFAVQHWGRVAGDLG